MLWFKSWHPSGPGATVGVCIALFALSIFDRYMHAMWRACNAHWARGRVWFTLPVARGELAYEDAGQVVMATGAEPLARSLTNRTNPAGAGVGAGAAGAGAVGAAVGGEDRRGSAGSQPPVFTSCATGDEKVIEKQTGSCCGGGVPAACNCGCGGECGQSSSPMYTLEPADPSRGLDKEAPSSGFTSSPSFAYPAGTARTRSRSHLPAAVAGTLDPARVGRWSRPFRPAVDIPRGLMWTFITALHYALMLVVMTFQIWWIISVVVGAGVGEMLFGRFGATR